MNGKPLEELRTEIECGLHIYPLPDGYCYAYRDPSDRKYVWAACADYVHETFDALLAALGEYAKQPIWTTFDAYPAHSSEEVAL